jgi:hypothetical protein
VDKRVRKWVIVMVQTVPRVLLALLILLMVAVVIGLLWP